MVFKTRSPIFQCLPYSKIPSVLKMRLKAYSLVELSIVLCILAVLMGAGIPAFLNYRKSACIQQTKQKQETLMYALSSYAINHGYLPFAAPPLVSNLQGGGAGAHQNYLYEGIIPYTTLKLQESEAKDGFGRWFTYAVAKTATRNMNVSPFSQETKASTKHEEFCTLQASRFSALNHKLQVKNGNDIITEKIGEPDFPAVVIVSHGPSGEGAFQINGKHGQTAHPLKTMNASGTLNFADMPNHDGYDDMVKWVSKYNLMAMYAKQPCIAFNDLKSIQSNTNQAQETQVKNSEQSAGENFDVIKAGNEDLNHD